MRTSSTVLAIVAVVSVAAGCSQSPSPSGPSSVVASTSAAASSQIISAQGGKSTEDIATIVLACDGAVNAQVDVQLMVDAVTLPALAEVHLECGPDSLSGSRRDTVKITTSSQAQWANVTAFTVTGFSGGCLAGTAIPGKIECPESSHKSPAPNAVLTFR
jgi:hypothetical protein